MTTKACKTLVPNHYAKVWNTRKMEKPETSFNLHLKSRNWTTKLLPHHVRFVSFHLHLWVNRKGVKSFYFLLPKGMLRGARESVSLSNNAAISLPAQENPGNKQGGSHTAIYNPAWLKQGNPHCYWKSDAGSYVSLHFLRGSRSDTSGSIWQAFESFYIQLPSSAVFEYTDTARCEIWCIYAH